MIISLTISVFALLVIVLAIWLRKPKFAFETIVNLIKTSDDPEQYIQIRTLYLKQIRGIDGTLYDGHPTYRIGLIQNREHNDPVFPTLYFSNMEDADKIQKELNSLCEKRREELYKMKIYFSPIVMKYIEKNNIR